MTQMKCVDGNLYNLDNDCDEGIERDDGKVAVRIQDPWWREDPVSAMFWCDSFTNRDWGGELYDDLVAWSPELDRQWCVVPIKDFPMAKVWVDDDWPYEEWVVDLETPEWLEKTRISKLR